MTTLPTAETIAELTALHLEGDLPEDMMCMRCHAPFAKELGDEQTQLCHDCAHWVVDQVPALIVASSRALELEAFLREYGAVTGKALLAQRDVRLGNGHTGAAVAYDAALHEFTALLERLK